MKRQSPFTICQSAIKHGCVGLILLGNLCDANVNAQSVAIAPGRALLQPFALNQVQLLDGGCKDAQELTRTYLRELDSDRLLYTFRVNAKLPAPGKPLGGWQAPASEIRGEFLGHYLSACAMMYASTGDTELKAKTDGIVAELAKCQEALDGEYLAAFPEEFFDRLESGNPAPCTYYVIHKIMAGLFDVNRLCANDQALVVLKRMVSYFEKRTANLSDEQWQEMTRTDQFAPYKEYGGMAELLLNLYSITGDPDQLRLAQRFLPESFLGPLTQRQDNLTGRHANCHTPVLCGAARCYELTGNSRYRTAAMFAWDRIVNTRTYATGGTSYSEHWPESDKLAYTLCGRSQEFCATFNTLNLTRYLLRWTADLRYADYYERAYFNHVLANQNVKGPGLYYYFTPTIPGATRMAGNPGIQGPYDAFWCCYGTSITAFAKLADSIYFHDEDGIYVNLFVASSVKWPEKGLVLEQRTKFPKQQRTALIVNAHDSHPLAIHVRIPYWATQGVQVKLNGKPMDVKTEPSSYLTLQRTWKEGDRLEVTLPMSLHAQPMPDDPDLVSFMYGPLTLVRLTEDDQYLVGDVNDLSSWILPVKDQPLRFRVAGQPVKTTCVPLYQVRDDQPYSIYGIVVKNGSPQHKHFLAKAEAHRQQEARLIDRVVPNDRASESAHNLQGDSMEAGAFPDRRWPWGTFLHAEWMTIEWTSESGRVFGTSWRHANTNGWWSWDMKVLPNDKTTLLCRYWVHDSRHRVFDILVDDKVIHTQTLEQESGEFLDVEYPIPTELTAGKEKVTVKFQSRDNTLAGPIYGCSTLHSTQ